MILNCAAHEKATAKGQGLLPAFSVSVTYLVVAKDSNMQG